MFLLVLCGILCFLLTFLPARDILKQIEKMEINMTNVFHSLKIRCTDYSEDTVQDGLIKNWTLRGTVHVFAEDDLPLFMHCNNGRDYRRNDWRGYTFWSAANTA